jgi:hypothetical protein
MVAVVGTDYGCGPGDWQGAFRTGHCGIAGWELPAPGWERLPAPGKGRYGDRPWRGWAAPELNS